MMIHLIKLKVILRGKNCIYIKIEKKFYLLSKKNESFISHRKNKIIKI